MNQPHLEEDIILQEIKREDFLNKIMRFLPSIVVGIVIIFSIAIGIAWWQHRHEAFLYQQGKKFEYILQMIESENALEAKKNLQEMLEDHKNAQKGFGFLAKLQSLALAQKDLRNVPSLVSKTRFSDLKKDLIEKKNGPLNAVIFASEILLNLQDKNWQEFPKNHFQEFLFEKHSFYPFARMIQVLQDYQAKNFSALANHLKDLNFEDSKSFRWMFEYLRMGSLVIKEEGKK